jgi:hypothetical protein
MREVEKELDKLARERARLDTAMQAAVADHAELARVGAALADVVARIEAAEQRWLEAGEALG